MDQGLTRPEQDKQSHLSLMCSGVSSERRTSRPINPLGRSFAGGAAASKSLLCPLRRANKSATCMRIT